jgi:hypothetical protein
MGDTHGQHKDQAQRRGREDRSAPILATQALDNLRLVVAPLPTTQMRRQDLGNPPGRLPVLAVLADAIARFQGPIAELATDPRRRKGTENQPVLLYVPMRQAVAHCVCGIGFSRDSRSRYNGASVDNLRVLRGLLREDHPDHYRSAHPLYGAGA